MKKSNKVEAKTKNAVDKTKDTITLSHSSPSPSSPSPSSPSPSSPSSFSNIQEKNYKESVYGVETRRTEFPSSEHIKEEPFAHADIKKQELATNAAENINQVDRKNNYRENNELINPFMMGIELWQNYSVFWMDYYKDMLNYTARVARDFGNTNEMKSKNSTSLKGLR